MRALVTGGVGFIGTIVGNNIFKMGYKIQGYKNSKPKKKFQFPIFFQKRCPLRVPKQKLGMATNCT